VNAGLKTISQAHRDLLIQCAEVCRAKAHQIISGSGDLPDHLLNCVAICDRCAEACEQVDGMEECGAVCRWCAKACRDLAS
jgi:hypothetical protein